MESYLFPADTPSFLFLSQAERFSSLPHVSSSSKLGWGQPWKSKTLFCCSGKGVGLRACLEVGMGVESQFCTYELGNRASLCLVGKVP